MWLVVVEWRKALHMKLMLPLDRPYFRSANRFHFSKDSKTSYQLINPHVGLPMFKQLQGEYI